MRHVLVPACLFICAWAQPANPVFEFTPVSSADATSFVAKTSTPRAETTGMAPAETTEQLIERNSDVSPDFGPDVSAVQASPFDEAGFATPLPVAVAVPVPPRRAIPRQVVCEALADAASDNNIPTPFLIRLIWQESGFNQNAVSPVGAQGVAQFMPDTAARMGLDNPFNPLQAVRASAALLRELFAQFGNLGLAAAAYNAGPKRVQDWLAKRSKLPEETRNYVQRITGATADQWKGKQVAAALRVPSHVPCQQEAASFAASVVPLPPAKTAGKAETKVAAKTEIKVETKQAAKADTKTAAKTAAEKTTVKTVQLAAKSGSHKKVAQAKATTNEPAPLKTAIITVKKAAPTKLAAAAEPADQAAPASAKPARTKTAKATKAKDVKVASAQHK